MRVTYRDQWPDPSGIVALTVVGYAWPEPGGSLDLNPQTLVLHDGQGRLLAWRTPEMVILAVEAFGVDPGRDETRMPPRRTASGVGSVR